MTNVVLVRKMGLYGITDGPIVAVPCVYRHEIAAISEWYTHEIRNTVIHQFLDHRRTLDEIDEIRNQLINSTMQEEHYIEFSIDLSLTDTIEAPKGISEEDMADLVNNLKKDAIEIIKNAIRATTTFEVEAK